MLYPLSLFYSAITSFRNFLFDNGIFRSHAFDVPVICVGNIAAGGTGKTPHCEYLINLLRKDYHVAVLSRGYKRKTRGFIFVRPAMRPVEAGDEPLQMAAKFQDVVFAVDGDRVHGIATILEEKNDTRVIILDDGYQHRSVKPGLSIVLTDYSNIFLHDHHLPYGNLRESAAGISRADILIVTKTPAATTADERKKLAAELSTVSDRPLFFTSLCYGDPVKVFNTPAAENQGFGKGMPGEMEILLVTGIARAGTLLKYLGEMGARVNHLSYPDHHNFAQGDIDRITSEFSKLSSPRKLLITTEKDAVRLREFTNIAEPLRESMFYIPVRISFFDEEQHKFNNLILEYVRENKRNS